MRLLAVVYMSVGSGSLGGGPFSCEVLKYTSSWVMGVVRVFLRVSTCIVELLCHTPNQITITFESPNQFCQLDINDKIDKQQYKRLTMSAM